jgi:hypothetical protein
MAKTQKSAKATGDSLEEAVQILEKAILRESASYTDRTFQFEPKKIIIVDGVRHEIDLHVSVDHGNGYTAIFIFECKNWKKKIGKSHIIEFSEKVKVAPAQKGFFVAKSFTRYARAQAKKDPRVELLCVEELDLTEVPSFIQVMLKSYHILKVISTKVEINLHLRGACDPVDSFTGPVEFLVDDAPALWDEYLKSRIKEAIEMVCEKFESIDVPEGTCLLNFKDLRHSDHRNCLINGVPLACIDMSGTIQVHIARPSILESQFEIANRGRVYRYVSWSPYIGMSMSIPQPMTQIRLGVNKGKEWRLTNAIRLFILDPTEPSILQHQFLQPVADPDHAPPSSST